MEFGFSPPGTARDGSQEFCLDFDDTTRSCPMNGSCPSEERSPEASVGFRRPRSLNLATPSSSSSVSYKRLLTPGTPLPDRNDLKLITGDAGAIFFDFDGTLTASPGDRAQRCRKQVELRERASLLAPRLRLLKEAGIVLGIISKSSEGTILNALECAGLRDFFNGPLRFNAVGLEGKAGFIEEMCRKGTVQFAEQRVLLVDDDVRELDRARAKGIQTYAAPPDGGLQAEDFEEIFIGLGLHEAACSENLVRSTSSSMVVPPSPAKTSISPTKRSLMLEPTVPELPEFKSDL